MDMRGRLRAYRRRRHLAEFQDLLFALALPGIYFIGLSLTDMLICYAGLLLMWELTLTKRHVKAMQLRLAEMNILLDRLAGEEFDDHVAAELGAE